MATAVAPNSSGSFSHAYEMPDRLTGDLATLALHTRSKLTLVASIRCRSIGRRVKPSSGLRRPPCSRDGLPESICSDDVVPFHADLRQAASEVAPGKEQRSSLRSSDLPGTSTFRVSETSWPSMQSSNAQPRQTARIRWIGGIAESLEPKNARSVAMRSHETLMEVGRDSRLAPSGSANIEAKNTRFVSGV